MIEKELYTGIWFLPESPEKRVYGTMSFTDKGNPLLFVNKEFGESRLTSILPILTGHVFNQKDHKEYTIHLVNVEQTLFSSSNNYAYQSEEYLIIEGIKTACSLKFNVLMLHSDVLNDWIKPCNNIKLIRPEKSEFGFEFKYSQPDIIKLYEKENYLVYCYFRGGYSSQTNRTVNIYDTKWINLKLPNEANLDELHKLISSFENLFTLLFKTQIKFTSIGLRDSLDNRYTHHFVGRKDNFSTNRSSRKGVKFDYFSANSQKIIGEWLNKQDELRLIVNNFFAAFGNTTMYNEDGFTTFVSILEQYHKLRFNDYEPKDEDYVASYEKALSNLEGDDLEFVKARLDKKNEIRLGSRLKDLSARFSLNYNKEFIIKLVNTRNQYIHLDNSKTKIFNSSELDDINQGLAKDILNILHNEISIEISE